MILAIDVQTGIGRTPSMPHRRGPRGSAWIDEQVG
jgi:hypothetical protein